MSLPGHGSFRGLLNSRNLASEEDRHLSVPNEVIPKEPQGKARGCQASSRLGQVSRLDQADLVLLCDCLMVMTKD